MAVTATLAGQRLSNQRWLLPHSVIVVVYVEVPEGSGSIVFRPKLNQYDNSAYSSKFDPERGVYYVFPGYLDHFVTRNMQASPDINIP